MASTELVDIVQSILMEPHHENASGIYDIREFCEQIGDWVLRLNAIALDESTPSSGSKRFILEAMESDAIQNLLLEGLAEDIDEDRFDEYLDVIPEIKEMASNMNENFPRTFPNPSSELSY